MWPAKLFGSQRPHVLISSSSAHMAGAAFRDSSSAVWPSTASGWRRAPSCPSEGDDPDSDGWLTRVHADARQPARANRTVDTKVWGTRSRLVASATIQIMKAAMLRRSHPPTHG